MLARETLTKWKKEVAEEVRANNDGVNAVRHYLPALISENSDIWCVLADLRFH